MTFFEQIYVIVLPKQQVLPQKNLVKSIFSSLWVEERGFHTKKKYIVKTNALCIFSKVIKKIESKKKKEKKKLKVLN